MPSQQNARALEAAFVAAGLSTADIDLGWLAEVKKDAEEKIATFHRLDGAADTPPAFSVWPELDWSLERS